MTQQILSRLNLEEGQQICVQLQMTKFAYFEANQNVISARSQWCFNRVRNQTPYVSYLNTH